jgi:anti-sigma regulatory factor (Ser/Thr protein kinase)
VSFVDMAKLGANPAHIIPAWLQFVAERPDDFGRIWGIGEPIGPDRNDAALVECQLHESLLNVAFAQAERFNLLCPYDTEALDPAVIAEAHRSHPTISNDGLDQPSHAYQQPDACAAPSGPPLAPPPLGVRRLPFDRPEALPAIRRYVQRRAQAAGVRSGRVADLVLAINELLANSFVHGGGRGVLRVWEERDGIVCEVSDHGRFGDPLAGRRMPNPGQTGGWGLWLANQLCELVQVRSLPRGSVVRLHLHRDR